MTPTVDRNQPPETWITAAPLDTITVRDGDGNPIPPQPGTIPFRYHLYWAGSDQDGTVVGFYWAVVETVGSTGGLPIPPLPGPKPRDYRYTSVRDSVFIFNVFEATNNRQHAFFLYAVDNQGKADPTPARVIFNSLDRYPPIPIILQDSTYATGFVFHPSDVWSGTGARPVPIETTIALRDTFDRRTQTSDIVPVGSLVNIEWTSQLAVAENPAIYYKYKIGEGEEVDFVTVPATVTGTQYNTTDRNRLGPGLKIFTLRAIDQAGGARTSPETTRRFFMNLSPDTWFAGPDTNQSFYTTVRYANGQVKERYRQLTVWPDPRFASTTLAFPGSYLSSDSVQIMPAARKPSRTFFELYTEYNFTTPSQPRHRIYVHSEGDTVHMNSWVLFYAGGFDPDSPYSLRILIDWGPAYLPHIGQYPVMTPGPANGSPIGFRYRIPVFLDSIGPVSTVPQSQTYPLSDPALVAEPHIGGYQGMQQSGTAYALIRAEDGSGGLDNRIGDPAAFVDSIEKRLIKPGSPRYALRDKVIKFYVNRAPYLLRDDPNPSRFEPYEGEQFVTRSVKLRLDKVADDDPFDPYGSERGVGGLPASASLSSLGLPVYRFSVLLRGRRTGSDPPRDTVYTPPGLNRQWQNTNHAWDLTVPDFIAGPEVAVEIEVCDCRDCEEKPGQGRCRRYPPIHVTIPALEPPAAPSSARRASEGPGSSEGASRSRTP